MANQQKQPARQGGQKRITFNIPKDLEAIYANVAILSSTPAEIILDFGQILPHMPHAKIASRVIMSPMHAKLLHMRLAQQIATFEQQNGEIRLPAAMDIASQFFKFSSGDSKDESSDESTG